MAVIVGIVASLVGPAIEIGKCIVVPIKRQFKYLCCFNSNIQNLRDEVKKLEDARDGLQMRVTTAKNNAEEIVPEVKTWLEKANEVQVNMIGIESEITNIQSGCLTVKSRFSLSKKVRKTTEAMKELRDYCNFNPISQSGPSAAMVSIPLGSTYEFESRKHIEEDIMITLRGNEVNMMGICGMGGVGKTTMAKRVMNRVREEHLFDEIVMVVVSQQVDMLRIQDEIAGSLGLNLEKGSLSSKARKLYTRLVGGKRILIVLDDVWKNLKLEDLGIPCESGCKGCTILLTSRDSNIFKAMNVQKVYALEVLSETEAWYLFKSNVGTCIDDHNVFSVAQEVVKECKGLPIAFVTVGLALKDEKNTSIWEDALLQLKNSNPIDIRYVLEEVYKPLIVSYDFLESQHARSLFLLCCLFPEGGNIPLKYLAAYAIGLRMFEGIRNLEQARNRTCSLVEMLKSRFLLLEGRNKYHVKMHDVVRDVSIFIASKERRINCNDCTWISSFLGERIELPIGLIFPNLRLLLIDKSSYEEVQINDNFFEGMRELNVLSIKDDSLRSLPHTAQLLKNLRTLFLHSCKSLETISVVGELVNLEILICHHCDSIEELPAVIGRLHRLRLLEFSKCWKLKTIVPGVISHLVGLEELKMVKSFDKWEAEDKGKERKNAGLSELQFLSSLTSLEIEIKDFTLDAEQINLPSKIVKYDITIGDPHEVFGLSSKGFEKKMSLHLPREITLGNWIHECVRSAEYMFLEGEGSNNLDLGQAQNMRLLVLRLCSTVKKLVNTTISIDGICGTTPVFPLLESLMLYFLPNLEEICDIDAPISEGSSSSFKNLKELRLEYLPALKHLWKNPYQNAVSLCCNLSSIYIYYCDSLCNLFSLSSSMANDCLLQLERLEIWNCEMMEQVVLWNEEENEKNIGQSRSRRHITFPKLKCLTLHTLSNLETLCKGIESIEFPLLTQMHVKYCPKLKSLVYTGSSTGNNQNNSASISHNQDHDSLHLFCKPKVAFGGLKELTIIGYNNTLILWCHQIPVDFFAGLEELYIEDCGNIKSLFSSSIAENLASLKILSIDCCWEMVKVIEDKEEKDACSGETCLFPNLELLSLYRLSKLKSFCEWKYALELPSLEQVQIFDCPKMERFTLGSLTTPNLETIERDYECITNMEDLNGALQQQLFRVKVVRGNIHPCMQESQSMKKQFGDLTDEAYGLGILACTVESHLFNFGTLRHKLSRITVNLLVWEVLAW